jgi:hypothetical protein
MPQYRALQMGFFNGCTYGPREKENRRIVTTSEPLKPVPSWLELITEDKPKGGRKGGRKGGKKDGEVAGDAPPAPEATGATAGTEPVSFISDGDTKTDEPETL